MSNAITNDAPATEGCAAVAGYVVCHVCQGRKKSPYGHWDCSCCKGRGTLTEQEYRIKTTIMLDLARRLRDPHTEQVQELSGGK